MVKKCLKKNKIKYGIVVASLGAGILIAIIMPIWGLLMAVGAALIYLGWSLINNNHC